MTDRVRVCLIVTFLALAPSLAMAAPIQLGDAVKFLSSDGSASMGGGAFHVDDITNGPGVDLLTFCLQRTQHIDYSTTFIVGGITDYADDAGGPDYISGETRWIYSMFRTSQLGGYSSDSIQAAIWILEGEWNTNVGNSAALITAAHNAVLNGYTDTSVKVLNLFYQNGAQAQDQLTLAAVPEPASMMLVGTGLLVAFRKRRAPAQKL